MVALPTKIIAEILSRLPVKSLLRFQCVCKYWYSLIRTPYFIKLHLKQTLTSNTDLHLLKWSEHASLHSADIDFHNPNHLSFSELRHPVQTHQVCLLGSCNGVVFISDETKNNLFLYNPLTNSHRKLPEIQIQNPKNTGTVFGFGYDSKNDDYKVLRIVQRKTDEGFYKEAQLYSLNKNSWKSVESTPHSLFYGDIQGVVVNVALHYIVSANVYNLKARKFIASFDLKTECFSLIDFPNYDDKLRSNLESLDFLLRELGGCLCLMVSYQTSAYAHLMPSDPATMMNNNRVLFRTDLWVMKEYANKQSWVRLFSIPDMKTVLSFICFKPIVYSKDGRKLLIDIDYIKNGWYDLESKKVVEITNQGLPDMFLNAGLFRGSLVLLEDKLHSKKRSLQMKNKQRNDVDTFLSAGFKLKL